MILEDISYPSREISAPGVTAGRTGRATR